MRKLVYLLVLLCAANALAEDRDLVIAVIVPAQERIQELRLTPSLLKLIYLRKQLYWPNGRRITPVNLHSEHLLRNLFSRAVLGSLPKQQIDYWNGLYFNGIKPPHIVNSEEAVIRSMSETPGAIGYINACTVDDRVSALLWIHDNNISKYPPSLSCSN